MSKEDEVCKGSTDSLQKHLRRFRREHGVEYKGGGCRNFKDQNMCDSIMSGTNGESLSANYLGRELTQTLEVSHRQIKRGRATTKSIVDIDSKRWKRRALAVPKNAIRVGEYMPFYYTMHSCIAAQGSSRR